MNPSRVFFYVQHLLGIGHLTRASRIADALAAGGFDVTMVTGGTPVAGFPGPAIHHVALPALLSGTDGFSDLVGEDGMPADEAYKTRRRDLLLDAYERSRPDVVITEAFPFGRRQMRFELLPLIERIEATRPRPLLAASVRDILQERTKPGRDQETVDLVKAHFDAVLVHGDPTFARLEESFPLAAALAGRIHYTGIVGPDSTTPSGDRYDIVVSAGGGAVGRRVMEAALGAARLADPALSWLMVTGPNLPEEQFTALREAAPGNVGLARFRTDFTGLLANARLSVSQAGYNTVGDILLAGCRSILIPFAAGGETEQSARAVRLQTMGRAIVLPENGLDGALMAQAVGRALLLPPPAGIPLDRYGAAGTAKVLKRLLRLRQAGGPAAAADS